MKFRIFVFMVLLSVFMIGCASSMSLPKNVSDKKEVWIYVDEADYNSSFESGKLYYCLYKEEKLPVCYEATVKKKPKKKTLKKKKKQVIKEIEAEEDDDEEYEEEEE